MNNTDHIHLTVQSGSGGNGCESYNHRTDRKAVPNGGDGGKGGKIIFRADVNAPAIANFRFRQRIIAESGSHGGPNKCRGKNAKDTVVLVPVGTRLLDSEKGLLIRHLNSPGDEVVVVEGGRGGVGNQGGKKTTLGERGQELELELKFRIQADAFLIGLPSSGKSTLMNALTHTHLKTEAYPFVTQSPEIGVCHLSDYEAVTLCELPSLYDGSREGRGCGIDFLAHLEDAKFIFFVLDPVSEFAESPAKGLALLRGLLEEYNPDFLSIPSAVLIPKVELKEAADKLKKKKWKPSVPVFRISAVSGEGLDELRDFLRRTFLEAQNV